MTQRLEAAGQRSNHGPPLDSDDDVRRGAILKHGDTVKGLTTAESLWVTSAIGLTAVLGSYRDALIVEESLVAPAGAELAAQIAPLTASDEVRSPEFVA